MTSIEVAAHVGRSHASVSRLISRYGWYRRDQREALRAQVLAHWVQCKGRAWLMRRYGLSRSGVHRIVAGVDGGPAKRRRLMEPWIVEAVREGETHRAVAKVAGLKRGAVTKAVRRAVERERRSERKKSTP